MDSGPFCQEAKLLRSVAGSSPWGGGGGGLEGGVSKAESEVLKLSLATVRVFELLPFNPRPELVDGSLRSPSELLNSFSDDDMGVRGDRSSVSSLLGFTFLRA